MTTLEVSATPVDSSSSHETTPAPVALQVNSKDLAEWNSVKPVVKNVKRRQSSEPKPSMVVKRLHKAYLAGKKGKLSLKKFAATLKDNEAVKTWLENKGGALERKAKAARQELKGGKLFEIAQASKSARKGSSK